MLIQAPLDLRLKNHGKQLYHIPAKFKNQGFPQ